MFEIEAISGEDKTEFYRELNGYLEGLLEGEPDWLAGMSNASSLLYLTMDNINWAGFYLYKDGELVLGPFQGKPACVRIEMGKGVCGTAAETGKIQIVKDVHEFPGHIACDAASQSEIVLPIIEEGRLIGVLDIDSPVKARFDEEDAKGLQDFIEILNEHLIWPEDSMGISEYQDKAMRTKNQFTSIEGQILNASLGLAGEVGECVDHIKKGIFHGHDLDKDYIKKELGDIAWYIALMSDALGLSMEDVYKENIMKLEKRYPNGFDKGHSLNRDE